MPSQTTTPARAANPRQQQQVFAGFFGQTELPGIGDAETTRPPRPPCPHGCTDVNPCPHGSYVWDGDEWHWFAHKHPGQLGVPGVLPGADYNDRDDGAKPVPWTTLEKQICGIDIRRGRPKLWDPDKAAPVTMRAVKAQTMRCADIRGLGTPDWLRATEWDLNANEIELLAAIINQYERRAGGLYDCQSTIATDIIHQSERNLRYMLAGWSWKCASPRCGPSCERCGGTGKVRRPGLVERGLVTAGRTWAPGRTPETAASDRYWLILRPGPVLESVLLWAYYARGGKDRLRPPRRSGFSVKAARRFVGALNRYVHRSRFGAAGQAWRRRQRHRATSAERSITTPPPKPAPAGGPVSAPESPACAGTPPMDKREPRPENEKRKDLPLTPTPRGGPRRGPVPLGGRRGPGGPPPEHTHPPRERSSLRSRLSIGGVPAQAGDSGADTGPPAGARALAQRAAASRGADPLDCAHQTHTGHSWCCRCGTTEAERKAEARDRLQRALALLRKRHGTAELVASFALWRDVELAALTAERMAKEEK